MKNKDTSNNNKTSYELGKDLFGKYGSGCKNNSTCYKRKIKKILQR